MAAGTEVRVASAADALTFGRLLHAFNVEFDQETPAAEVIAERAAPLIESGKVTVLFVGEGPDGFAELRFRPSLYTGALDAYLEEFYVVPERRWHGLGRACSRPPLSTHATAALPTSTSTRARPTSPPERSTRAPASPTTKAGPTARGCSTTSGTSSQTNVR
jgi:GNAT superfamily N-acetyltransferase